MSDRPASSLPAPFPRVPGYAWSWLQRSRPVLEEVALRLSGGPPTPSFLEELRTQLPSDPFVQGVVMAAVADVAFHGRLPARRPAGTAWDRGLTWWAATICGTTAEEFESRSGSAPARQQPLFGPDPSDRPTRSVGGQAVATVPRLTADTGRQALAVVLRQLLDAAEGGHIPIGAVHQLLAEVEGG